MIHRVRLTGLQPGQACFYRLVCKPFTTYKPYKIEYGPEVRSEVSKFTAPNFAAERVRFLVFNDLHDNVALWKQLHALVANEPVNFVFLNGDVTDYLVDEKQVVEHFLDPMTQMFGTTTPLLYARGNHETRGAWSRQLKQYLDLPDSSYHYAMTWGPARFTVLDTGEDKRDDTPVYAGLCDFDAYRAAQQRWLGAEVASSTFTSAKWRIVIHHIPAHYNGYTDAHPDNYASLGIRANWWPILNRSKVDLYLGGHTHKYTVKAADPAAGHAFPVVIGGGPKKGTGTVMLVDAGPDHVALKMWRDDGEVVGNVTV